MKTMVVDASAAAKWFLPEEGSAAAERLLSGRYRLVAPDLIRAEVGNLLWKLVRRGNLEKEEAGGMLRNFLTFPVEMHGSEFLVEGALEIAMATDSSVYDSLYVSLAVSLKGQVITADERLVNRLAGGPFSRYVRLLGRR